MYYPGGGQAQTNIAYQDQISTSPRPDTNINPHPPPYTEYGQAYPQQPFILQPQPLAPVQQQVVNTNVVLQQPAPVVAQGPRDWTSGLLDCGDNGTVCCIGLCSCFLCVPFLQCQLSGSAGECCCVGIMCPIALRTKIRTKHNIENTDSEMSARRYSMEGRLELPKQTDKQFVPVVRGTTFVTPSNPPATMNGNTTTSLALQTNAPAANAIPRYVNPISETPRPSSTIEMTSSSRDTKPGVNGNTAPRVTGTMKPPYAAVTQDPEAERGNIRNGGQGYVFGAGGRRSQRNWSTGLFSCLDDWSSCLLGFLCPCCLAMTISCTLHECCCTANCYPVATRTKIRTEYNIIGTICEDAYVLCWCYQCALCQMAREIDDSNADSYTE